MEQKDQTDGRTENGSMSPGNHVDPFKASDESNEETAFKNDFV